MKQNTQLVIAGGVKPPATKTEIIEAMAIRRVHQLSESRLAAEKEYKALSAKFQAVAAEEMKAGGKPKEDYRGDTYDYHTTENNGHMTITGVTCSMSLRPSAELCGIIRRAEQARKVMRSGIPCMSDIKNDIRAEINQHTPSGQRVATLLKNTDTIKAIDEALAKVYQAPSIAA